MSVVQDLATKDDLLLALESMEHRLTAAMEQMARRVMMWTFSMVLASAALAFAAGRFLRWKTAP
jgi:hypothetical protein